MEAVGLSILAAFGFASSAILSRQGMQAIFPLPGVMVSLFVSFLLASAMVLLFAFSDIRGIPQAAVFWILGLGVMNFLGGRSQNFLSVNLIGASRASLFVSSQAPFAAIFAVTFTGESIHPLVVLGTAGVVGGLLFASGDSISQGWRTDKTFLLGYLMALGAGASYGATNVMAKHTLGGIRLATDDDRLQHAGWSGGAVSPTAASFGPKTPELRDIAVSFGLCGLSSTLRWPGWLRELR